MELESCDFGQNMTERSGAWSSTAVRSFGTCRTRTSPPHAHPSTEIPAVHVSAYLSLAPLPGGHLFLFFFSSSSPHRHLHLLPSASQPPLSATMLLGAFPTLSLRPSVPLSALCSPLPPALTLVPRKAAARVGSSVVVAAAGGEPKALASVIFEPFEEVKKELALVTNVPYQSIARQKYADDCETAINEQINVEYNVSYVYHAMFAYFDRDNVALRGMAKFFQESSEEEREHAEKLMKYQNVRGGKVKLQSIIMPLSEFDHPEKGDALHAMELALSLEKLVNEKLLKLHSVAEASHDVQMSEFVEREYLGEQVESIKKISEYVAQLRRVGKGHGVWHFDQMLLHEDGAA